MAEEKKGDSPQQVGGESVNSAPCRGCYKPGAIHTESETVWAEFSEIQSLKPSRCDSHTNNLFKGTRRSVY